MALAQTPVSNQAQGQFIGPYGAGPGANNNNNAWGIANTPSGSAAAGPLSTLFAPNTFAVPTPGNRVLNASTAAAPASVRNRRLVPKRASGLASANSSVRCGISLRSLI